MEKLVLKGVVRFFRALFSARKWQKVWNKDWVLKLVSVLLATLLWSFVGGEDVVDKNVMVPVEIINLPRDLVISNQFKKEIEVTVSGPRSLIQDMTNKAVARQINLSNATPGTNVIENDNKSIPVPRGITVLRIQPTTIILSLDKLIQKQFDITPVTSGVVSAGFDLENLVMNPDVITITGPETILSQAEALMTDVIDIHGMTESKQIQIPLDLEPSFIDLIGETSVTADITVRPKMVEKKISKVVVDASIGGSRREVAPETVDVIVKIPVLLLHDGIDVKKLFSVTAIESEEGGEFLKVSVIPHEDGQLPLEVVSIIPQAVKLVRRGDEVVDVPSIEEVDENIDTDEIPEEQQLALDVQDIVVSESPEKVVVEETENLDTTSSEVKILPAKKKIIKLEQR